ncbi:hypothetical protein BKH46_09250 [Helicobacter sp. 12S02634-8]|uniref:hypothetical protein n=1 Tax=Helicobacter sp. 12S02634-8 TaxID=1476199 RepID=UPI000BA59FB2|nr:hypothetical protein [Helicobacter sp. 12S02634-8]PAF45547.1 hypothetical protein BKH46_09250 [Helicobacter sp. 12S02634-8]
MKSIIKITGLLFITSMFANNAAALGIEEKTGNVWSFQFGYGLMNGLGGKHSNSSRAYTPESAASRAPTPESGGFNFQFKNAYEIFFTQMHGLRLSTDIQYGSSKAPVDLQTMGFVGNTNIYSKVARLLDLSINLDYRIDFFHRGKWDIGAFAGGGVGYAIQTDKVYVNAGGKDVPAGETSPTYAGGGWNLEGGLIATYSNLIQFELNAIYKRRDLARNLYDIARVGNIAFNNLAFNLGIGFKF